MKKLINATATEVKFTFEGLDPLVLRMEMVHEQVLKYAAAFGLQSRIGDAAALSRKDGSVITEAMRRAEVQALVEYYEGGAKEWSVRSAKVQAQSPGIVAMAAKFGITYAEAEVKLTEMYMPE